jgi:tetratricopeptide (TPR) repeat protein
VAATFISQLRDLDRQCPDASNLLRVIAFLDPESIPLEMLITGAKALTEAERPPTRSPLTTTLFALIQSPVTRQNAINHLQSRCLVTYHAASQSPTFRIHDLIQLVVLEDTKSSGLGQQLFESAVELVCAAFRMIEEPLSPEWWPQCELLVPHIQALTLRQDTSIEAKKVLLLINRYRGSYLCSRGRYAEAESLCQNIIADMEQLFGPDDFETLAVVNNLACVYLETGRYLDAETLFKQVLENIETQLGPEHRLMLVTLHNLAKVYYHQDRNDDAEKLLKQILQSLESQFGPENDNALRLDTIDALANIYHEQKRYDEAKSLLTQVLQARERLLGLEHEDTLHTQLSLGNVYYRQRHFDAAAALLQQVLLAREKRLGLQHPQENLWKSV